MSLRDKILKRVQIKDIYTKTLKHNRGHCATHKNTSSPSFLYYPQTETWNCFSCGTGGDAIGLYAHINNITYSEAIRELAFQYEIDISEKDKKRLSRIEEIQKIFNFFTEICHKNLIESKYYEDITIRRGFNDGDIKEFNIGLFDEKIKKQMNIKFDQQLLFDAGFLNDRGNWYIGKRIVYPYLNYKNEPSYFIYRLIDIEPDFLPDAKYVKHVRTEYVKETLFGINSISKFRDKPLVITEGITDSISVIRSGYPCISPVTIRFKDEDIDKMLKYCTKFDKVVIINDNEENGSGIEGAKKTLRALLKSGINTYIGEIPKPIGITKIDLNDYLKKNGNILLEGLIDDAIEGFTYLLSFIDKYSSQEDIKEIFRLVPKDDLIKSDDIINEVKTRKGTKKANLEALFKIVKEEKKKNTEPTDIDDIFSESIEEKKDENILFQCEFENGTIQNRIDGVHYIIHTQEGDFPKQVLPHPLKIIHKTRTYFHDVNLYSYEFDGKTNNTQTRREMIDRLETFKTGGDRGKDVIKTLVTEMGRDIPFTELEFILGFNDGWILPDLQEKNNYRILVDTDYQKRVYHNCVNLIKPEDDIDDIRSTLVEFFKETDMEGGKIATIIGWSVASLFRLCFIKYFKFAPDLLVIGDPQTGKTAFSDVTVVGFYKAWEKYIQGAEIATKSSFEDAASTSTFPVMADELEYIRHDVIDPMKARSVGIPNFTRKTSSKEMFSKPEVAGFCITTNEAPNAFRNNALIERFMVINFSSDEVITENQKWNDVARELTGYNLFTPIYVFTKDWNNDVVFSRIKKIQDNISLFPLDARTRKKFIFICFGLDLFNDIFGEKDEFGMDNDYFGLKTALYNNLSLFDKSGRIITGDLLSDFVNFCNIAINYEHSTTNQNGGVIKGDNPKFLTTPLKSNNTNDYIFIPANLRDFNDFMQRKKGYNMRNLSTQLNKSVGEKDYFKYGVFSLDNNTYTSLKIPKDFNDKIESLKD